jgi:hypothetical protein
LCPTRLICSDPIKFPFCVVYWLLLPIVPLVLRISLSLKKLKNAEALGLIAPFEKLTPNSSEGVMFPDHRVNSTTSFWYVIVVPLLVSVTVTILSGLFHIFKFSERPILIPALAIPKRACIWLLLVMFWAVKIVSVTLEVKSWFTVL